MIAHLALLVWASSSCGTGSAPTSRQLEDIADVPNKDVLVAEDKQKRYFLVGPMKKTKASKLLVVLPGGPGSADFNPFVCRILKNALPTDFVIAQLVAPSWSPSQAQNLVWPTAVNTMPEVKFSTEEFIDATIADASKRTPIDAKNIYLMGWSSSGPPLYAYSLTGKNKTRGAFVAMSIFRDDIIPKKPKANGGRFYILHSPQDFIPISQAEDAKTRLAQWGASVKFQTYQGGHGWHGDVFGSIRTAIDWLMGRD